ncbi:MAG: putative porin [Prevotellaceae bacterium]|nr:putative porin [Prevotellaceae bacterium]
MSLSAQLENSGSDGIIPDAVEFTLPDSTPPTDTAVIETPDSVLLEPENLKKKQRRIELLQGVTNVVVDTNKVSRIFKFTIDRANNNIKTQKLDTALRDYYIDYPFFREDVGAMFLGYLGSPVVYFDYFKRSKGKDFIFLQPYEAYFPTPDNVSHYNTTTPYSILYYSWTSPRSKEEMQLRLLHAQNITNKLSFGLAFNNLGTKGIYQRQHVKSKMFHGFISHLGDYYKVNAGYIYNAVSQQQNGGIQNDASIRDTIMDPPIVNINLTRAKTDLNSHTFYLTHSLDLPFWYIGNDSVINNILYGRIGHTFEYNTNGKKFTNEEDAAFYETHNISRSSTRDSLWLKKIENRLFFQVHPLRAYIFEQLSGGWGYRAYKTYMFDPMMYLKGGSHHTYSSMFFYASASAWYKQYFNWNAYGELVSSGYNAGDYKLQADLTLSIFPIKGGIHLNAGVLLESTTPDYFLNHYFSNNFSWNNDFDKTTELRLEGMLSIPFTKTEISVKQSVLSNLIYFEQDKNQNVMPYQSEALSITGLTVNQNFRFGGFHFRNRFLLQVSSNSDVVSLPTFSYNGTYYFELEIIKNVLTGQLGFDFSYNTKFKGLGYEPSIGMFYNSTVELGGYPWVDAFLAFRWKRATPFIKFEHLNQNLFDGVSNNYFSAAHYPRNARVLKFGLSWKFFD